MIKEIQTPRLLLRQWQDKDVEPFTAFNQDPRVVEFLQGTLSRDQAVNLINKIGQHFKKYGYGLWAATLKDSGELIGFIGLNVPPFEADFTPCVEIGWRLGFDYWGKGYATEGAKAVLDCAFNRLHLDEIVSFAAVNNKRSIRVMEKLGMQRDQFFNHPWLSDGHRLQKHVLYRLARASS